MGVLKNCIEFWGTIAIKVSLRPYLSHQYVSVTKINLFACVMAAFSAAS